MHITSKLLTYRQGYLDGYHAGLADGLAGEDPDQRLQDIGGLPLSYLELSTRICNCLRCFDCETVGDVAGIPSACIQDIPQLSAKDMDQIARSLHRARIVSGDPPPN